jgi:hypothetical protein
MPSSCIVTSGQRDSLIDVWLKFWMTFMEFLLHLTRNSALSDYSYTESYLTSATPMTIFPRDTTCRSTKE